MLNIERKSNLNADLLMVLTAEEAGVTEPRKEWLLRALQAEALTRELVEALGNHTLFSPEKRTMAEWDECEKRLEEVYLRAKEVLGE